MSMEVRNLLSQVMLDTLGHGSGNPTPKKPKLVVMLTPPPHRPKELPKLVDTSSQVSVLDDVEMAEASLEGVPTTISHIAATTRSRSSTPPADMAELWEKTNKTLEELLATKSSIDTHMQRAIWELGMELHQNESKTAESIKEARAVCSCVLLRPCVSQLSRKQRSPASELSKKPRPPMPAPSGRLKPLALQPSGMPRPGWPLRLSNSTGNMPKPSETWRNKSSKRKAEANQLPLCLSGCPTCQPSGAQRHAGSFLSHFDGAGTLVPPIHLITRGLPSRATIHLNRSSHTSA